MSITSLDLNSLDFPKGKATQYIVRITNGNNFNQGTYEIRDYLRDYKFHWNPADKAWLKKFAAKDFTIEKLLAEYWVQYAKNVIISVKDEFDNTKYIINIKNGKMSYEYLELMNSVKY